MRENRTPEIVDADLSAMMLALAAWGGGDVERLPWLTPPPPGHVAEAKRLLVMLGALDTRGAITARGREMASLPCHPRIANMLVQASASGLGALAADIAAILEEKDPLGDENDADIGTRIDMLRDLRSRNAGSSRWKRIMRIAAEYRRMVRCAEDNTPALPDDIGALIASAEPERIAMRMADGTYRLSSGENVRLNEADNLSACDFWLWHRSAVVSFWHRLSVALSLPHWRSHTKIYRGTAVRGIWSPVAKCVSGCLS